MRRLTLTILLILAAQAGAQTSGDLFPLTNTRYGTAGGLATLRTDGQDVFAFWTGESDTRVTKVVEDRNRIGERLFDFPRRVEVVWTGTHFLAVTHVLEEASRVIGRLVDRNGHPAGGEFLVLNGAESPRLAAGHGSVLMVYRDTNAETRAVILTRDGRPAVTTQRIGPGFVENAVTATATGFAVMSSGYDNITITSLDPAGREVARQLIPRGELSQSIAAAASGTRSLFAWASKGAVEAVVLDANGSLSAPLIVGAGYAPTDYAAAVTATWNGSGWTVAYALSGPHIHLYHLDALAQRIVGHEQSPVGDSSPSLLLLGGTVKFAWTRNDWPRLGTAWMSELPLAQHQARAITFASMRQTLLATTASAESLLAVWAETGGGETTVRAGRRRSDGHWVEHVIAAGDPWNVVAASSDGHGFVVFLRSPGTGKTEAIFLDEDARPTGLRVALPQHVAHVAWNGRHFALIDDNNSAVLLDRNGALSPPTTIDTALFPTGLVSNGDGFLLVGGTVQCPFLLCYAADTRAVRLTPALQRAGPEIVIEGTYSQPVGAVWTGSEYVVAWQDETGTGFARIDPSSGAVQIHHGARTGASQLVPAGGGDIASLDGTPTTRAVVLRTSTGSARGSIEVRDVLGTGPILNALSAGRFAYVVSTRPAGAPHYGQNRVMMLVAGGTPPPSPDAPRVSVIAEPSRFLVQWSAPPGTVNGYRLEYRIDDGAWIELERWFGPGDESISIRKPSFGTEFAFRVRAFNDSGVGPYSNEATPVPRKRRAVR